MEIEDSRYVVTMLGLLFHLNEGTPNRFKFWKVLDSRTNALGKWYPSSDSSKVVRIVALKMDREGIIGFRYSTLSSQGKEFSIRTVRSKRLHHALYLDLILLSLIFHGATASRRFGLLRRADIVNS